MIETRGLGHRYGDTVAVDDVSLVIPDGAFVLVVGANGSGKTTLVRHFNRLLDADEGTVLINGKPAGDDLVATRTAVGMVFQDPRDQLVASTVGADVAFGPENLGLDREEIERRVRVALAAVTMDGRETERVEALSGGERARVAIAGALAMEPDHLVLDEPLSGLDDRARRSLVDHLRAVHAGGTSVVVVTHDVRDLFSLADRVVGMANGRISVDAPPAEALSKLPALGVRVPTDLDSTESTRKTVRGEFDAG